VGSIGGEKEQLGISQTQADHQENQTVQFRGEVGKVG